MVNYLVYLVCPPKAMFTFTLHTEVNMAFGGQQIARSDVYCTNCYSAYNGTALCTLSCMNWGNENSGLVNCWESSTEGYHNIFQLIHVYHHNHSWFKALLNSSCDWAVESKQTVNQLETVTVYMRPITNLTTTTAKKNVFVLSAMQCGVHGMYDASVRDYTDSEISLSKQNFS